jgi:anti-sigma factor RsiW
MSTQHLSDEAIAAFADGKLSGLARDRAVRHTARCAECNHAVAVQREAVWALRAAPAPSLPSGLFDRLCGLPQVMPVAAPPTVVGPDGTAMFAVAPAAALVPDKPRSHRTRPAVGAAALLTTFGLLAAGSGGGAATGQPLDGPSAPVHQPTVLFATTSLQGR